MKSADRWLKVEERSYSQNTQLFLLITHNFHNNIQPGQEVKLYLSTNQNVSTQQ
jgi:hypothetical protein